MTDKKRRGAVLLFLAAHALLGLRAIRAQSPTYDEPLHLTAGYAYWKTGDYRLNAQHHPPLASLTAGIPLLFMGLQFPADDPFWRRASWRSAYAQYMFARDFLARNAGRLPVDDLFTAGRAAILAVSCLFLLVLFESGSRVAGPVAGWTALFLGAFSQNLLAHATLVTTDFMVTAFFFLFFYLFWLWERAPSPGAAARSGAALGLALCSKFSAALIFPIAALRLFRTRRAPFSAREIAVCLAAAAAVVVLVYRITQVPLFFSGLFSTTVRLEGGRASFLMGAHRVRGWWYYFPLLFLIKTPPPVLIGLVLAAYEALRGRFRPPWFLWLPPSVFFLAACASPTQIGHRHILPVYPFLFVLLGALTSSLWKERSARWLLLVLGLWQVCGVCAAQPYYLSYFNELIGGTRNGYLFAADSNGDWGQGLKALRDYQKKEGVRKIYLSYFGTASPADYGIVFAPVQIDRPDPAPRIDVTAEPRQLLAVSATNFQGVYYSDQGAFAWLASRKPAAFLAGSILVFDVSCDAESHRKLAGLFAAQGDGPSALREAARARELDRGGCRALPSGIR